ncbi:MAG: hypothetical protein ACJ75E_16720 [Actinomycetes bacterium]
MAAVALGLALSTVIQLMTSYYTATQYKPVREIAEASAISCTGLYSVAV